MYSLGSHMVGVFAVLMHACVMLLCKMSLQVSRPSCVVCHAKETFTLCPHGTTSVVLSFNSLSTKAVSLDLNIKTPWTNSNTLLSSYCEPGSALLMAGLSSNHWDPQIPAVICSLYTHKAKCYGQMQFLFISKWS